MDLGDVGLFMVVEGGVSVVIMGFGVGAAIE